RPRRWTRGRAKPVDQISLIERRYLLETLIGDAELNDRDVVPFFERGQSRRDRRRRSLRNKNNQPFDAVRSPAELVSPHKTCGKRGIDRILRLGFACSDACDSLSAILENKSKMNA